MRLYYKTRGMGDPKGKPKVYFSCHPDEFEKVFPVISEDLLRHANCAVWFDAEYAGEYGTDLREPQEIPETEPGDVLKEMQLAVFAVTSRFLHEGCRAREQELPLALKLHIPVLPIALENGLEYDFNKICAEIQVVSRYVTDSTATPYEEVLQTFLDSVLVGNELAERVREAFDAYVFLSYRKKDRRHAQRLMRLIHENPQFRDIAIWYDEYLVPGEGFNEAIKAAFENSSLFAMAVTPHLEEEGNYVMQVEYPMARDREKKESGFKIVSVEMYDPDESPEGRKWRIDSSKLKGHEEFRYREITDLKDEHRVPERNQAFIDALERIAKKENDGSPRHRFFIGLAYLNGIDVEVDFDRALGLIRGAAEDEKPCIEATEKLAQMYQHGEGVEADRGEALRWQRRVVSQYKSAYDENHDPDEHKGYGTAYFKALRKLSDMLREGGDIRAAIEIADEALSFSEKLEEEVGIREQERDRAVMLNRLGSLYRDLGKTREMISCYEKAAAIYERLVFEIGTKRARRDLSVSYERLGDISRVEGDLQEADSYYEKALRIRQELSETSNAPELRRDLSAVLTKLGNVRKSGKDYAGAGTYYEKALAMDKVLAAEVKTPQAYDDLGVSLVKIGDIRKAEDRMEEAAACYERACDIFRVNMEETGSRLYRDHFAAGCEKHASVKKKLGKTENASELYREAVAVREQLYEAEETASSAHALAASYYNAASFFRDREMMKKAYELWDGLCVTHPEYGKYRDKAGKHLKET